MIPFPVKYHIYFGEPMRFEGDHNDGDEVIGEQVEQVTGQIQTMIDAGLEMRRQRGSMGIFL